MLIQNREDLRCAVREADSAGGSEDTASSENRCREGFLEKRVLEEKEDLNILTLERGRTPQTGKKKGKHKSTKVEKYFSTKQSEKVSKVPGVPTSNENHSFTNIN